MPMDHDGTGVSGQCVRKPDTPVISRESPKLGALGSATLNNTRTEIRTLSGIARDGQAAALAELTVSQDELSFNLSKLLAEMEEISSAVNGLTLDPATYSHMEAARESLRRSRAKLITVRGRLGRLRGFEESDRLFPIRSVEAAVDPLTNVKESVEVAPAAGDSSAMISNASPDSPRPSEPPSSENARRAQIRELPP